MSFYNFKLSDPSSYSSSNGTGSKTAGRFVHKTFQDFHGNTHHITAESQKQQHPQQQPPQQTTPPTWYQQPTIHPIHYQVGGSLALPPQPPPPPPTQTWLPDEIAAVSITASLQNITHTYSPLLIGSLHSSGSPTTLRLVKLSGQGVWHSHAATDEVFILLRGTINMLYRTGSGVEKVARVVGGELLVVPMRMEHCAVADEGTEVLLLEGSEGVPSSV